jgi:hypothetical protein
MPQIGDRKHIVELSWPPQMRYSSGLRNAAPEFGLWIVNLIAVFVVSRYLFGKNSRGCLRLDLLDQVEGSERPALSAYVTWASNQSARTP